METIIEVSDLHKRYGETVAVDGIGFTVHRGEIFGLLGPNGAGKTTTVEALQGLRRRDRGRVSVLGLDPEAHGTELRRRIGSQLQASALPDRLRVLEAAELFAAVGGTDTDAGALLAQWGLADKHRATFSSLSGGQKQRLFIALALVGEPEVVFLDELTTGLDPQARRSTWDLIRQVRERGTTVVLVTHFMDEAEILCDRVAIVDHGRIVALDTPAALTAGSGLDLSFTAPGFDPASLSSLDGVERVTVEEGVVRVRGHGPVAVRVAGVLWRAGIEPADFRTHHPDLEEAFLALTGRSWKD